MSSLSGAPQSPVPKEKPLELTALYDGALKAGAAGGPSVPLLHATGGMGVQSTSSPQSDMLDLDGVDRVGAGVLLKGFDGRIGCQDVKCMLHGGSIRKKSESTYQATTFLTQIM